MKNLARASLLIVLIVLWPLPGAGRSGNPVLFHEDFNTLDKWQPVTFPKIKKHSTYTIEKEGKESWLRTESKASASAIVHKETFNVYHYSNLRWRWKVNNIYRRGNGATKTGDDYPLRIYVMFAYEPEKAGALERIRAGLIKSLYGEYPPHSSLSYVWASRESAAPFFVSPYTEKAVMAPLEKGSGKVGAWREEEVNIVADYEKAFGARPPARARIAIMNDSDNTGEAAISWVDYLTVLR